MEGVRGAGGSTAKWRCGRTLLAMQVSHGCDFLHLYPAQTGRLRLDRNSRSKAARRQRQRRRQRRKRSDSAAKEVATDHDRDSRSGLDHAKREERREDLTVWL
jgi:hypothetical protein